MTYQGPGKYKHFKGNVYDVVGEAIHTESNQIVIVYRDGGGTIFVRPKASFDSAVFDGNKLISLKRFTKLG